MPNRLASESSPYLRQHADNPVDWYPWGDEALTRARDADKPILLSIGYAACHWCHVMAHESFEDPATAAYMNEHFVNIKVDREERPDIDAIYIEAAQAISGHAGWPLTAFLTPSQAPFFVGTYFPPEPRADMPSFMQLMEGIADAWANQRDEIEAGRDRMIEALSGTAQLKPSVDEISEEAIDEALFGLAQAFDPVEGGFDEAPKFPPHSVNEFLMGIDDEGYREFAYTTLRKMVAGGIFDQLAGGFARYSVDERWRVPHFEKMLYDNALLARNLLHAWQQTGDESFRDACRRTLDWMTDEMRGDEGGFASSLDADSLDRDGRAREGAFYAWGKDEFAEVVASAVPEALDDLLAYWGVNESGAFEGLNVLHVAEPALRPADEAMETARTALLERRATRPRPGRDDKRIASWNALAVAAFAEAGSVLNEPRYLETAVDCAKFIERELRDDDGRLIRSWLDATPGPPAYLEDYAYVTSAYLTLYEQTFDDRWFTTALDTANQMIDLFADDEGGFFTTAHDHEALLVRRKDMDDAPIPGGNASAALTLLRLAAFTGDSSFRRRGEQTLKILSGMAARYPTGFGAALQAIDLMLGGITEVAIVGNDPAELRSALNEDHNPHRVVAGAISTAGTPVPLLEERSTTGETPTAFVCRNFTCSRPVTTADELRGQLNDHGRASEKPQIAG
ncbi:MAG: thioredoxin domain-containing protein [Actinobacteria bacterium]|nr:thioredoxin domain-containing protein [Actinomycetota bacterium]